MYTLERLTFDSRGVLKRAPKLLHRSKWEYFPEYRKYWTVLKNQTVRCLCDGAVIWEVDYAGKSRRQG